MKISTKGRYAVRLMADLAEHDAGEYISLKEISDRQIKEYLGGITLRDLMKKPKKNGDLGNIYIEALENADNTDKSTHPEERP